MKRGWYYRQARLGRLRIISLREKGAKRGVSLICTDDVCDLLEKISRGEV